MGVISRDGEHGLRALMTSEHATSGLTYALNNAIANPWINGFFNFFTSICMLTAFLGVSLGLFDFLADGLKLKKTGSQGTYTWILTFLPPLIVVLFYPGIYLYALSYAGVCCVILLLLLPAIMSWQGRKQCTATAKEPYLLPGGNLTLGILSVIAVCLLAIALFY